MNSKAFGRVFLLLIMDGRERDLVEQGAPCEEERKQNEALRSDLSCLGISLLRHQGWREQNLALSEFIFARKAVLARLGASTTLNNSNNTRILQHLNNVRPSFERYGNVRW